MRRTHFEAFAPVCPVCAGAARHSLLVLAEVARETDDAVLDGMLHCADPACQHEYPIIDGVPVIVADLGRLLSERGIELMLRDDLPASLESLLGDAIGPDTWLDVLRQTLSTYAWDSYAAFDPEEHVFGPPDEPQPGAATRCLARLLELSGLQSAVAQRTPPLPVRAVDLGCGAGGTSFALAASLPGALVLGIDLHLGLLRLAAGAARGLVSYPRRRIGMVYDRRRFAVSLPGAERVDFWAADALALPLQQGVADVAVALNLLDCVADPRGLLASMAGLLAPRGAMLLATPFDWSTRATKPAAWIGGHSQRAAHAGAAEPFLRDLMTAGAHPQSLSGMNVLAEDSDFPWHTRLHARSSVRYRAHLLAASKDG